MGKLWLKGYTVLQIESLCSERFFNLCQNRGIKIYKLYPKGDKCLFTTSIEDFHRLKPVVRKTKPGLRIKEKRGLPFLANEIFKHQFFLAGILMFFMVLFILSRFVWSIDIQGNYLNSTDELYRYLESIGITYGAKISTIDCEALEAGIRRDYDNIIWVSVAINGTRLDVDVRESQDENIIAPQGTPSNIIAPQDGVVKSIIARSGTPAVKPGDIIKEGDILISGTVITVNESSEPIKEEYVYADGTVELLVKLPYTGTFQRNYIKKEYTGHTYKSLTIRLGTFQFDVQPYTESYEYQDDFGESWILCPYQNFYLPLGVNTVSHHEYVLYEAQYTDEELESLLNEEFAYYLQKIEEKGIQIIEKNVTISINENEAQMDGYIYVLDRTFGREEISIEHN